MAQEVTHPWQPFFDPLDDTLWARGSDVDWLKGTWVHAYTHPASLSGRHPFIPVTVAQAERLVRLHPEQVLAILGALLSWRVCTVDQLMAGLAADVDGIEPFYRDAPTVWGALLRLGVIDVGFSRTEFLEGRRVNQTWVAMGSEVALTRRITKILGVPAWMRDVLTDGKFGQMRSHARHNTLVNHVALTAAHDERFRFVGGDGWGGFRGIDPQAVAEIGSAGRQSADMVGFVRGGVTMALELQIHAQWVPKKLAAWADLLAYSPMRRSGILCVWLQPPVSAGVYEHFDKAFKEAAGLAQMAVGEPTVASRMGYARWDEWYDEQAHPTGRWGEYADMYGTRRSVFDPAWADVTPHVNDADTIRDWGWKLMDDRIRAAWGWDVSRWKKPEALRGGFYGFVGHDISHDERRRP